MKRTLTMEQRLQEFAEWRQQEPLQVPLGESIFGRIAREQANAGVRNEGFQLDIVDGVPCRLDDCERKHELQSQALEQARMRHDRLQRKLALVTGLLIARLGSHSLPDDFLRIILDEGSEGLPEYDLASAA